jgi:thiamine biosynthesis lipoprotein
VQPKPLTPRALATILIGLVVLTSLTVWRLGFTGPGRTQPLTEFHGETMGTVYTVKAVDPPISEDQLAHGVQSVLDALDAKMSTYLPDSELSQFNAWLSREPFPLSRETLEVMALALDVSRDTGGAYDITVGPLVNAWGFGPGGPQETPPEETLSALRARTGYALLTVDVENGTAQKGVANLYVDLSSVAKGYAVDRVALWLENQGIGNYMVEVGGEVRTGGHNPGGIDWQIGVRKPVQDSYEVHRIVGLSGRSMATSGDYQNFYERDGKRYSHIIDPRTRRPIVSSITSVTVIAETCAEADAYATGLTVLGPDEGIAVANEQGLAVLYVLREGGAYTERASLAFIREFGT